MISCIRALTDVELITSPISEIVLIGGMTRMPKVRQKVKELLGKDPNTENLFMLIQMKLW